MRFFINFDGSTESERKLLPKLREMLSHFPDSTLHNLFSEDFAAWVDECLKGDGAVDAVALVNKHSAEINKLVNRLMMAKSAIDKYEKAVKGLESSLQQGVKANKELYRRYEKDVNALNTINSEHNDKVMELEKMVAGLKIQMFDIVTAKK